MQIISLCALRKFVHKDQNTHKNLEELVVTHGFLARRFKLRVKVLELVCLGGLQRHRHSLTE